MIKKTALVKLTLLFCVVVVMVQWPHLATAEPESPDELEAQASAPHWSTPALISQNSPFGAKTPVVRGAPNGNTVMVVYIKQNSADSNDTDPYYRRSPDNGKSWPQAPQRIHNSAAESLQVDFAYTANGVAHAVWIEGTDVVYAREGAWANNQINQTLSQNPGSEFAASNPNIVASGNNRLDVIWAEITTANPNIYHARSNDGGNTWPIQGPVAETPPSSLVPSLAVGAGGVLHAVWEEHEDPLKPDAGTVYYARGTQSGGNISWNRVKISDVSGSNDAREPKIVVSGNIIHVAYTDFETQNKQWVHHIQCSSQCLNQNNWQSAGNPVSGQVVGVNPASPFNVLSDMLHYQGCTYVYFHGTSNEFAEDNEVIWGINSCDGWSASARDQVTNPQTQSIYPSLTSQSNWWVYLAYGAGDTEHQIYFLRNDPAIYLPALFRS